MPRQLLDSPRMAALKKAVEEGDRAKIVTGFWEEMRKAGTPLVEPLPGDTQYSWVTFLWQSKENTINVAIIDGVASGIGGADSAKARITHLKGTDVWYRTYKVRNDAAFHYWISPNDSLESLATSEPRSSKAQPDPLNLRRLGPVSYIELPAAHGVSLVVASPSLDRGRIEQTKFHREVLNNDRDIWVYTPPGYRRSNQTCPLLCRVRWASLRRLDAGAGDSRQPDRTARIPPMVAVLVGSAGGKRGDELACHDPSAEFLAMELVPWMRKNYDASGDPSRTVVGGQSPLKPLKISMSAGLMEIPDQLDTNRHFRDVLVAKGYSVHYSEFNDNHSYVAWRADFADRLVAWIGTRP
jgi:enterochelin esterase family protein